MLFLYTYDNILYGISPQPIQFNTRLQYAGLCAFGSCHGRVLGCNRADGKELA